MYRLARLCPRLGPHSPPGPAGPRALRPAWAALRPGPIPIPIPIPRGFAAGSSAKDAREPPKYTATDPSGENKKLNKSQQLKQVFKEYGAVGVSFHVGISLVSLGIFYLAVSSGVDMTAVLLKLGFSESSLQSRMAAGTSTFVLAYAVHKLFAPVRISITVVSVPFVVRYCRKIGFFKPPASSP
ncbi:protein FAM210B, mitochondrial [Empidonax traillii]|uniref:protein FAM210B, mitochondrial n=1 Tax=Empidonax traillii TaxID=164674 RepID=UPI000FFD3E88|nr:protein FAM210B, mitochondrial [Empidonax traillii]